MAACARPRNRLRAGVWLTLAAVLAGGFALRAPILGDTATGVAASGAGAMAAVDPRRDPDRHAGQARAAEVRRRFEQAVLMLHARQYEHAVTALHRVLELAPDLPEAQVNMGFALSGLGRQAAARDFFSGAIALRPDQANAYYGLALGYEADGDLDLASGAMRTYLHLARNESAVHLRRAQAALWEWQARLEQERAKRLRRVRRTDHGPG